MSNMILSQKGLSIGVVGGKEKKKKEKKKKKERKKHTYSDFFLYKLGAKAKFKQLICSKLSSVTY